MLHMSCRRPNGRVSKKKFEGCTGSMALSAVTGAGAATHFTNHMRYVQKLAKEIIIDTKFLSFHKESRDCFVKNTKIFSPNKGQAT